MHDAKKIILIIFFIGSHVFWPACNQNTQKNTPQSTTDTLSPKSKKNSDIAGNFSNQAELRFDSTDINSFLKKYPLFKSLETDIRKFYSGRDFTYAWYDNNGMIEQADNLYNNIMNIGQEGLPDKTLYKDSLTELFDAPRSPETELMLTAQYFDFAKKTWQGISEKDSRSIDWFLPRKKIDLSFLMDSLLRDTSSSIIKNGYSYRQYGLLKDFLKRYRNIAKNKWAQIKPGNKSYKQGDSSETIKLIREKLFLLGDLSSNPSSAKFDKDLTDAVKHYQQRLGITVNGTIGPGTIKELNNGPEEYIRTIIVNMERCRWVPVGLTDNYFIVNIPAFELFAFQNDSLVFTMKVVVGKAMHKTVIFNGDLKYVVFSPYWNVPPGILKNEILPAIKKDPHYLKKHNMEWDGKSVRQKPGPNNSLGLVKFLFPNTYNIYLHDSPAKSLFNENVRAFSHGCIRVAQPKKLAMYLLRDDPKWTENKIVKAMKSRKEQYVTLKKTVPVFIAYLTAWVDRSGNLNIRKDIYHRDARLEGMIMK